ncbi:VWA domain-containing protein [Leptospira ognonensis]|uniref:VWA domain-containing protein n=1 Tax=Leptospira ognonensis TaxID=2484945 RepID=A0A4R9KCT3_9LEPT|nr:VWA domain-containing protein [Leptospira ognonensis]TGL62933.1 VWA domain-containing protein [Leptospira ognonensis]
MEWDQLLFYHGFKKLKSLREKLSSPSKYFSYEIESEEKRIRELGKMILGNELRFQKSDNNVRLTSDRLAFPEKVFIFENAIESKQTIHFMLSYLFLLKKHNCFMDQSELGTQKAETYHRFLMRKYPGLRIDRKRIKSFFLKLKSSDFKHFQYLSGFIQNTSLEKENIALKNPHLSSSLPSPNQITKPKSEFKTKFDLESAELLEVDKKKIEEYTLGHNFEKIETAEEFDGQWRDLDGSDNAEEEAEALNELNLKHMIRSEDPVHTTVSSDTGSGTILEVADLNVASLKFKYDEWNFKNQSYKIEYCSVEEDRFLDSKVHYADSVFSKHKFTMQQLNRKMYALVQERNLKKRVANGDQVDIDAVVDLYADICAKVTPSELLYIRSQKEISNMTLFFLMDLSLSTDSWIGGNRILDVERESLLLFSNALESLYIPFEIGAFYSRTRNQCKFLRIKSSKESLQQTKDRLGALEPIGYTRIGPALRHTGVLLDKVKTKQKWIILFTDAHPNDYDRYEGKYGTEDVNQAVKELKQRGIFVHTLAIGRDEKPVIPKMMREASYQMLADPKGISDSLHRFFAKAINL